MILIFKIINHLNKLKVVLYFTLTINSIELNQTKFKSNQIEHKSNQIIFS